LKEKAFFLWLEKGHYSNYHSCRETAEELGLNNRTVENWRQNDNWGEKAEEYWDTGIRYLTKEVGHKLLNKAKTLSNNNLDTRDLKDVADTLMKLAESRSGSGSGVNQLFITAGACVEGDTILSLLRGEKGEDG